ncbi:hypothetical protein N7488_003895 [Penicillium malachiteum]|nr:hypothetical protein N7488_003895 [Penicillium malachiteum]
MPLTSEVRLLPELKEELQALATSRRVQYAQQSALLVRSETDNTNAKRDVTTMHDLLSDTFGIACTWLNIKHNSESPTWQVTAAILESLRTRHNFEQPSLFVFYYAGHASLPADDASEQFALENDGRYILWSTINELLFFNKDIKNLDTLFILDSPFGGDKLHHDLPRTTELLAAGRPRHTISITQKIYHAVNSLRADKKSITIDDLCAKLKDHDNIIFPVHTVLRGRSPIVLTFKKKPELRSPESTSLSITAPPSTGTQNVIVQLTMPGSANGTSSFAQAICWLSPDMQVDVLAAYETD